MLTLVFWAVIALAAVLTVGGVVLDAMRIRDERRLCSPLAELMAIWDRR
jgi:hypothetical protein